MFDSLRESGPPEYFLQLVIELLTAEASLALGLAVVALMSSAAQRFGINPSNEQTLLLLLLVFLACALAAYAVHRRARTAQASLFRGKAWLLVPLVGVALIAYAKYLLARNDAIAARAAAEGGDYFMGLLANGHQDPMAVGLVVYWPGLGAAAYGFARLFFWLNSLRRRNKPQSASS